MEGENKIIEEGVNKPTMESRMNGNMILVKGGTEDELLDLAMDICVNLDKGYIKKESEKAYLLSGDEIRPGVWSVKYDKRAQEIRVQNRNAFGSKEYNEKMLRAVEVALA